MDPKTGLAHLQGWRVKPHLSSNHPHVFQVSLSLFEPTWQLRLRFVDSSRTNLFHHTRHRLRQQQTTWISLTLLRLPCTATPQTQPTLSREGSGNSQKTAHDYCTIQHTRQDCPEDRSPVCPRRLGERARAWGPWPSSSGRPPPAWS